MEEGDREKKETEKVLEERDEEGVDEVDLGGESSSTQPTATISSQTTKTKHSNRPRKSFKTNLLKKKPPKETKQQ